MRRRTLAQRPDSNPGDFVQPNTASATGTTVFVRPG